jgi:UrcA family protein
MKTVPAAGNLPRLAAAIVALLALGGAAVCTADDRSAAPHTVVKFNDLNLWNPDGATALYGRLYAAAYEVCGSSNTLIADLPNLVEHNACIHSAVRNAVIKVNQPALSAIYNARNRDPLPSTLVAVRNR